MNKDKKELTSNLLSDDGSTIVLSYTDVPDPHDNYSDEEARPLFCERRGFWGFTEIEATVGTDCDLYKETNGRTIFVLNMRPIGGEIAVRCTALEKGQGMQIEFGGEVECHGFADALIWAGTRLKKRLEKSA